VPLAPALLRSLVCPRTHEPLRYLPAGAHGDELLVAPRAGLAYRVDDGVPVLLVEEARPLTPAERAAALALADTPAPVPTGSNP